MPFQAARLIPGGDATAGIALVVAAAALWATVGVAVQLTPEVAALPDTVLAAARTGIAGIALLAVWIMRSSGRLANLRCLDAKAIGIFAVSSAVFQVALFRCFEDLGVTVAVFLTVCLPPVIGSLWAALRRPGGRSLELAPPLLLALAGVALVSLAGPDHAGSGRSLEGLVSGVIASVAFVAMSLSAAQLSRSLPAVLVAGAGLTLSSVLLGGVVLLSGASFGPLAGGNGLGSVTLWLILYLAMIPTALAYLCYCSGMARCRTPLVGLVASMIEPILAALLAMALIGEKVTPLTMLGCALLAAAMVQLWRGERRLGPASKRTAGVGREASCQLHS